MGSSNVDVSVLVPVYNMVRYLPVALDSLLAQTLPAGRMEIVCIDDGSTDDCPAILRSYEARCREEGLHDFRVITLPHNLGYGHAMNVGLQAAHGIYVGILEPDDYVEPNAFSSLLAVARLHDADVVKANFYTHTDSGESDCFVEALRGHTYNTVLDIDADTSLALLQPCIWSALYLRDFLLHERICFNETPGASFQDTGFAFQVYCRARRMVLVPDAYVHYRTDNATSSIHARGKEFAVYDEMALIDACVNADAERRARLAPLAVCRAFWLHRWNLARIDDADTRETANLLMSARLRRAQAEGYIDQRLYSPHEMAALIRLLHYR